MLFFFSLFPKTKKSLSKEAQNVCWGEREREREREGMEKEDTNNRNVFFIEEQEFVTAFLIALIYCAFPPFPSSSFLSFSKYLFLYFRVFQVFFFLFWLFVFGPLFAISLHPPSLSLSDSFFATFSIFSFSLDLGCTRRFNYYIFPFGTVFVFFPFKQFCLCELIFIPFHVQKPLSLSPARPRSSLPPS